MVEFSTYTSGIFKPNCFKIIMQKGLSKDPKIKRLESLVFDKNNLRRIPPEQSTISELPDNEVALMIGLPSFAKNIFI